MDQVTIRRDYRMFRLTSQHIDRARCLIILSILVGEEWTGNRISNPSARFVLVQRPLKRAHEHVALGTIVEDHAKTCIRATLGVRKHVAHLGDVSLLSADNEPATGPDLRL